MLDIETLGTGCDAAIVSIGAVAFNAKVIIDEIELKIDFDSATKYGEIDAGTIKWWFGQDKRAQEALIDDKGRLDAHSAAHELVCFLQRFDSKEDPIKVWGNGAEFDNVLVSRWLKRLGYKVPWSFWNNRCYRTIKALFKDVERKKSVAHCALEDARDQTEHLLAIAKKHNIAL